MIAPRSLLENAARTTMKWAGIPEPVEEYRFHPKRKWRFDFAWPDQKVALETEGGTWQRGRHVQPVGFEADCEKYSTAAAMGWAVIRVTGKQINSGLMVSLLEMALDIEP